MTSKISAKFLEIFRNLKSDAVPRPPRQETNANQPINPNNETEEQSENVDPEEVFGSPGSNNKKSKNKSKSRKSSSTSNKESSEVPEDDVSSTVSSNVNTQATGNVINIVNSNNVRWGNEFVYYMGPVHKQHEPSRQQSTNVEDEDEKVEKTDSIQSLLESSKMAEHEYLDYISKNLGKNWHRFFRKLGYKQGQIETVEIDMAKHGVAEARYKLLLDWIRNDDDGTIGRLSTVLWECGEKQIVKELANIHSQS